MLGKVAHIGLTVSNMEESIHFYEKILGLNLEGQMLMKDEATDKLFNIKNCKVKLAYLKASKEMNTPTIELIEFEDNCKIDKDIRLDKTSISEVCFSVDDIDKVYSVLLERGVEFLSKPQYFVFTSQGFGKSKEVYFKDPDRIVLKLIESIK